MPVNPSPDFYFGIAGCIMSFFALTISIATFFYSRHDKKPVCSVTSRKKTIDIVPIPGMPDIGNIHNIFVDIINNGQVVLYPEQCEIVETNTHYSSLMIEEGTEKVYIGTSWSREVDNQPIQPFAKRTYSFELNDFLKDVSDPPDTMNFVAYFTLQNGNTFHSKPLKISTNDLT